MEATVVAPYGAAGAYAARAAAATAVVAEACAPMAVEVCDSVTAGHPPRATRSSFGQVLVCDVGAGKRRGKPYRRLELCRATFGARRREQKHQVENVSTLVCKRDEKAGCWRKGLRIDEFIQIVLKNE